VKGNFHARFLGGLGRANRPRLPGAASGSNLLMLLYFMAGQGVTELAAVGVFRLLGRQWSRRHTLLACVAPVVVFLVWVCLWCWAPLSDLAPIPVVQELFDLTPSVSTLLWKCFLPILFSWLLFFWASNRRREHEHDA